MAAAGAAIAYATNAIVATSCCGAIRLSPLQLDLQQVGWWRSGCLTQQGPPPSGWHGVRTQQRTPQCLYSRRALGTGLQEQDPGRRRTER